MTDKVTRAVTPAPGPANTAALKDKFKARSIPLEEDFHSLIDMADAGRLAAGLSPDQSDTISSAKTGLVVGNDGRLAVKPQSDGGLDVAADGVAVKKGNGIDANADAVTVKANNAQGIVVDANGVGINHDSTLRIVNTGQLGVADNYVTKTGNSTITGGGLTFGSDDQGISFFGGSRITKKHGSNMLWYKGANNATPQICDNDGRNASNIATESYVDGINGWGESEFLTGNLLAFEIGSVPDYWPVDIDFVFATTTSDMASILSGRACAINTFGIWSVRGIVKDIDNHAQNYSDELISVKLFKNNTNNKLAIGVVIKSYNRTRIRWRVRINGGTLINIGANSFSGYTELASA